MIATPWGAPPWRVDLIALARWNTANQRARERVPRPPDHLRALLRTLPPTLRTAYLRRVCSMSSRKAPCPRCGIDRHVHENRPDRLCADCRYTEPNWPRSVELADGDAA